MVVPADDDVTADVLAVTAEVLPVAESVEPELPGIMFFDGIVIIYLPNDTCHLEFA